MADEQKNRGVESLHGIYMMGTLEGVDFRGSGNFEGKPFPAKVTLNFTVPFENKQTIKGVEIVSNAKRSQLINLSTSDDLLPIEVERFNKQIGQHLTLSLVPVEGSAFKLA